MERNEEKLKLSGLSAGFSLLPRKTDSHQNMPTHAI